ncbi:MAG: F(420)H(2) dehydrogenase subunit C [Candidatus Thorarchaeota archaeon AB_25]|nr:MAG: F(420)H(2) dehydrogenase subunit C [Candidatus Thorarchaeota archaeon AB_25]
MSTIGRAIINKIPEVTSNPLGDNKIELVVPKDKIRDVVTIIDEELQDAIPESVFGIDLEEDKYELIYIFWSYINRTLVQLRVSLEGEKPEIESTCDIFPGLEWHEREVREMFGIEFKNHPDPRLFLLPDELDGAYPMRKRFQTDQSRLDETGIPPPKPRSKPGGEDK